jgi:hypothetical protein
VDQYLVVVQVTWASGERRLETERSAPVTCYGARIRRHRDEPAQAWLTAAVQLALETGSRATVRQRFLRPTGCERSPGWLGPSHGGWR